MLLTKKGSKEPAQSCKGEDNFSTPLLCSCHNMLPNLNWKLTIFEAKILSPMLQCDYMIRGVCQKHCKEKGSTFIIHKAWYTYIF